MARLTHQQRARTASPVLMRYSLQPQPQHAPRTQDLKHNIIVPNSANSSTTAHRPSYSPPNHPSNKHIKRRTYHGPGCDSAASLKSILRNHNWSGVEPGRKVWVLARSNAGPPITRKAYEVKGRVLTQDVKDRCLTQVFNHKTREGVTLVVEYKEPSDWDDEKEVRKVQRSMHSFKSSTQGSDVLIRAAKMRYTESIAGNNIAMSTTYTDDKGDNEGDDERTNGGNSGEDDQSDEGVEKVEKEKNGDIADIDLDIVEPTFVTDDELLAMVGDESDVGHEAGGEGE